MIKQVARIWKIVSILTAALTAMSTTSCMGMAFFFLKFFWAIQKYGVILHR